MNTLDHQSSFLQLIARVFAGVGGGLLGTSLALLVIMGVSLSPSATESGLQNSQEFTGIILILVIFVASFVSNMSALFFLTLTDASKYRFKKHILQGGFFANISLFIFALPFYITISDHELLLNIAGVHIFLAASSSALFAEIFSGIKYVVSGVVGVGIAQMIMIFTYIALGAPSTDTMVTILFIPFIWFLLPLFIFLTEKIHTLFFSNLQNS